MRQARGDAHRQNDDHKALLLFFYSPTSGPSRRMDSIVSWLCVRQRPRLRLRMIDGDVRQDLLESFGLSTVPSLALVKDGQVVACLEGRATGNQVDETFLPHLRP